MRPLPILAATAAAIALSSGSSAQQEKTRTSAKPTRSDVAKPKYSSRQEIAAAYEKRFADLDSERIADLAALAADTQGRTESEAAYSELFNLAVTRDQYEAAGKAAKVFLDSGKGSAQTKSLASFVNIMAASNRGEYDRAVKDLDLYLKGMKLGRSRCTQS